MSNSKLIIGTIPPSDNDFFYYVVLLGVDENDIEINNSQLVLAKSPNHKIAWKLASSYIEELKDIIDEQIENMDFEVVH